MPSLTVQLTDEQLAIVTSNARRGQIEVAEFARLFLESWINSLSKTDQRDEEKRTISAYNGLSAEDKRRVRELLGLPSQ